MAKMKQKPITVRLKYACEKKNGKGHRAQALITI